MIYYSRAKPNYVVVPGGRYYQYSFEPDGLVLREINSASSITNDWVYISSGAYYGVYGTCEANLTVEALGE